jgi:creatinine amidohydrolase
MTYVAMTTLTWPEAESLGAERPLGLIPTASVEQHGPHLPLGTDSFIAEELGRRIGGAIAEAVVVAPVVPGGLSSHHLAFPGTVNFSEEVFGGAIDAYVGAFERMGIDRVAIFSGHGGNLGFLGRYEKAFADRGSGVRLIAHHDLQGYIDAMFTGARIGGFEPVATDVHAGGVETSQGLAAFPALVRPFDGVTGYTANEEGWLEAMLATGIHSVSPTGVLGDVAPATEEAGELIFVHITDYLVGWIVDGLGVSRVQDEELVSGAGSR